MLATLVYRSKWSTIKPLVYSDDSYNSSVNTFMDRLLKFKLHTKRLKLSSNKYYYEASDEYKELVVRLKKIK